MRRTIMVIGLVLVIVAPLAAALPNPVVAKYPKYIAGAATSGTPGTGTPSAILVGLRSDTISTKYWWKPRIVHDSLGSGKARQYFWIDSTAVPAVTVNTWGSDGVAWAACPKLVTAANTVDTVWVWAAVKSLSRQAENVDIRFRVRDTLSGGNLDSPTLPESVQVMDMSLTGTGGWLAGRIYDSAGGTLRQNYVVLAYSAGIIVGSCITEHNGINEGYPSDAGYFMMAARAGTIDSVSVYARTGYHTPDRHFTQVAPPWTVVAGDTTWVDVPPGGPVINNVFIDQLYPVNTESVQVSAKIYADGGVRGDSVQYAANDTAVWSGVTHASIGADSVYHFWIPPQDTGAQVWYRVAAYDSTSGGRTVTTTLSYRVALNRTIYGLQYSTDPNGSSPDSGKLVHVTGVVTGVITGRKSYLGEGPHGLWHGVHMYRYPDTAMTLNVGDSLEVVSLVHEFNRMTQLDRPYRVTRLGTGLAADTTVMTVGAVNVEGAEGVLLRLDTIRVLDSTGRFNSNHSYRAVNRTGTETTQVYIDAGSEIARIETRIPESYFCLVANGAQYNLQRQVTPRVRSDIIPLVADLAAGSIIAPAGKLVPGDTVSPRAVYRNLSSTIPAFGVRVNFNIGGAYIVSAPIDTLLPGAADTVTFAPWTAFQGTLAVLSYIEMPNEPDRGNDTARKSIGVYPPPPPDWVTLASVPAGNKGKNVKDGGALAFNTENDTGFVYALKGNNRYEFYKYNTLSNAWTVPESIPAIGRSGKKKAVKKGSFLVAALGKVFAAKGNNSTEIWRYTPGTGWAQVADIPVGAKTLKEGVGAAAVEIGGATWLYVLKGGGTSEFYRYNTTTDVWETMANAPLGASGKGYKNGSCVATADGRIVYTLKGSYNELFSYHADSNMWFTKAILPMVGSSGKKKKVKDGAGLAAYERNVHALKGGNTLEHWNYLADSDRWVQDNAVPTGTGRNVKGGGALTLGRNPAALYALKGNNTLEFHAYVFGSATAPRPLTPKSDLSASSFRNPQSTIRISPNPFADAATVSYSLPAAGKISLKLYNVTGQLVTTLAEGHRPAGSSSFTIHRSSFASGVYLLKLESGTFTATRKLTIQ